MTVRTNGLLKGCVSVCVCFCVCVAPFSIFTPTIMSVITIFNQRRVGASFGSGAIADSELVQCANPLRISLLFHTVVSHLRDPCHYFTVHICIHPLSRQAEQQALQCLRTGVAPDFTPSKHYWPNTLALLVVMAIDGNFLSLQHWGCSWWS